MGELRGMVAASGRVKLQTVEDPGSFLLTHELIPMRFATVAEEQAKEALSRPSWSVMVCTEGDAGTSPAKPGADHLTTESRLPHVRGLL